MSNVENNSNEHNAEIPKRSNEHAVKGEKVKIGKSNQTVIIIAMVVFVFLLALVPILINVFSDKGDDTVKDNPDIGIVFLRYCH